MLGLHLLEPKVWLDSLVVLWHAGLGHGYNYYQIKVVAVKCFCYRLTVTPILPQLTSS